MRHLEERYTREHRDTEESDASTRHGRRARPLFEEPIGEREDHHRGKVVEEDGVGDGRERIAADECRGCHRERQSQPGPEPQGDPIWLQRSDASLSNYSADGKDDGDDDGTPGCDTKDVGLCTSREDDHKREREHGSQNQ